MLMRGDGIEEAEWTLGAADSGALLASVVSAAQVRGRYQFFVWTQAQLQQLLPHGVLVCGVARANGCGIFYDHFYSQPVQPSTLARLCHPRQGIVTELAENWRARGCEPMAVTRGDGFDAVSRLANELHGLALGDAVVHGIPSEHHASGAHAMFAAVALPTAPTARELRVMRAVVPSVFGAYCRALMREDSTQHVAAASGADTGTALSEREIQILRWVRDGKSNQEIGAILSISPLTVKNHMQRILRKLQAANRTQAVSKAMAMRLLGPSVSVEQPGQHPLASRA
jgi:transcriptional regulator EpsA